jgi:hypothetical protein
MATVYPAIGKEQETAARLLELAENPADVVATTDTVPGTGHVAFVVPDYLVNLYNTDTDDEKPVAPKRRGRPPKNLVAEGSES